MTQWHFTSGDGQWLPFTDYESASLTVALAEGRRVVTFLQPDVQRNVDLVHMVMRISKPASPITFAAVSNEISAASTPAATFVAAATAFAAAVAAAEATKVQPPAKRANRSESVLRLSFFFSITRVLSQRCLCRTRSCSCNTSSLSTSSSR